MNPFSAEPHLAQQLRRDKLRYHHTRPVTIAQLYDPPPPLPTMLYSATGLSDFGLPDTTKSHADIFQPSSLYWADGGSELPLLPSYSDTPVWMNVQETERTSSAQGLSLSLSPNPLPELNRSNFESRSVSVVGPLGPFTGYAAVLRSSRFLKPGQQLLDEFCRVATGSRMSNAAVGGERASNGCWGNIGLSFQAGGGEGGGGGCLIHPSELQQQKTKLLSMQEEVCRRYKQYHQQIQMVVSSFESVPGLCAATPYTSLALKGVMRHFRSLKIAITDQLQRVSKIVSQEFLPSPDSSKGEPATRIKYLGQSIPKEKTTTNSFNFLEHSQPVWRPQRGLPERAVAVLRAWLFEHFLHPYPTDTDKHILAAQTGLSRNQVSNWFINARVRLWKPMVEEIHTLETNGSSGMNLNSSNRNDGKPLYDVRGHPSSGEVHKDQSNKMTDRPSEPIINEDNHQLIEHWHREKRMRTEACSIPVCMDGSLMSLAGYPAGMDISGLGAVSLTLGLQHNEDAQQQQMRHFGGNMVHDFGS